MPDVIGVLHRRHGLLRARRRSPPLRELHARLRHLGGLLGPAGRRERLTFLGHFGAGFAAKALAPRVSLGWLFAAAQFIDLLWPALLLAGVERVRIEPGATAVSPLVFEHYPVSHSLAAVAAWGILVGAIQFALKRDRRGAAVLAALVASHWFLDAIVHQPDLPLYPGSTALAGMNAWSSPALVGGDRAPDFRGRRLALR